MVKNPIPLLTNYVKVSIEELKKVSWPTRRETIRYSVLVVGIGLALALVIGIVDFGLTSGMQALVDRLH